MSNGIIDEKTNKKKTINLSYKTIGVITLIMGLIVIYRDTYIYNLNEESNKLSKKIVDLNSEKEDLELKISKMENVQVLMETAIKDLNMKYAEDKDYIEIDFSKTYFDHIKDYKD